MEWLTSALGVGASVASGGLFGILGSVVGVFGKYLQKRQEMSWEREKWAREERMFKLQLEAKAQETEQELAIVSSQGAWQGLDSSVAADREDARGAYRWVNSVRSLFRPVLTVGLFAMVYMLWRDIVSGSSDIMIRLFSESELKEILRYIVYSVVFTATTAGVWWWGDRALTPPGYKSR